MAAVETLEVLSKSPLTTVQDRGRVGFGHYGVPPCGALDSFSLRIGNLLVGNSQDEACLEITVMGPRIKALTDTAIAVTGADLQPLIHGEPLEMWRSHVLCKGEVLSFKGLRSGCRAYLAIGGGISVTSIMGSKSTNLSAQFGGLEGRPLRPGDVLLSESPHLHLKTKGAALDRELIPPLLQDWALRVILGPQDDDFPAEAIERFLHSPFKVTPRSDRAGIRLSGPALETKSGLKESIISEGVVTGTIQVPGDAQPIILLGETVTGGYRKIATVISADLPLLGQLKPGDTARFFRVSLEEAYQAIKKMEDTIEGFKKRVQGMNEP
ncbi:MAG: biotin-dependent carboxyltransferase family protein [Pseudomonadota bacterium]